MVVNYMIVSGSSLSDLEAQVKEQIKYGWEPDGNIIHYPGPGHISNMVFAQKLIKTLGSKTPNITTKVKESPTKKVLD